MTVAVVVYPNMLETHFNWITNIRKKHSNLEYVPIKPHFTIVFPIAEAINIEEVTQHIEQRIRHTKSFQFAIRCAVPKPEWNRKQNYVFLVPDEGFSHLIRLHDALYTDILEPHLSRKIPYLPHITIGHCDDVQLIKQIS